METKSFTLTSPDFRLSASLIWECWCGHWNGIQPGQYPDVKPCGKCRSLISLGELRKVGLK